MRYYNLYVDNTNDLFVYCDKNNEYEIGERVEVIFTGTKRTAFIISHNDTTEFDFKVLPILKKASNYIKLSSEYIKMIIWIKNYYLTSYSAIINAILPKNIKIKYEYFYKIRNVDEVIEICEDVVEKDYFIKLSKIGLASLYKKFGKDKIQKYIENGTLIREKQNVYLGENNVKIDEVIRYFLDKHKIKEKIFTKYISRPTINKLMEKNLLEYGRHFDKQKNIVSLDINNEIKEKNVKLNPEQEKAFRDISNSEKNYFLIKGVTGSGKTEVYISLIKEAFKNGKGSIFLVPEISLTPQMVDRFRGEFKENIAILHSKLTPTERAQEWYDIYSGNKKIVLGVRSAIFAPIQNLGYIIIDEEHENTYKQDSNPRYDARQVAIIRGLFESCKVVFGSATPSVEMFYRTTTGEITLLNMNNRYNDMPHPPIKICDMTREKDTYFSTELLDAIRNRIIKGEQVMLLLNRKGYSTYVQCEDCGYVEECSHCSIKYSYYASQGILKCNYCGEIKQYEHRCPQCGSIHIVHGGKGVERVEEELKKYFDARIITVEADNSKKDFEKIYFDFFNKKYDIMIGTQLISKGFHFPNVTLVGVINADTILNFPDFRAGEKTFDLVLQVAGRSGREKLGEVITQTYQSESPIFKDIAKIDYMAFYKNEIMLRKILKYPPFSKMINIGLTSIHEKYLIDFSKYFYNDIKYDKIEIYEPKPALVYRVKDRYRYNIIIKGDKKEIYIFKKILAQKLENYKDEKIVRISVDVDPVNIF